MEFSTQLRLILLLTGAMTLVAIYLLGKRHGRREIESAQPLMPTEPLRPTVHDFGNLPDMDDDELDTPAYLRRNPHEARSAESLPTVMVPADEWDEVSAHAEDDAHEQLNDFTEQVEEADDFRDDDDGDNYGSNQARQSGIHDTIHDQIVEPVANGVSRRDATWPEPELEPEAGADAWPTSGTRNEPMVNDGAMDDWTRQGVDEPALGEAPAADAVATAAAPVTNAQVMQTMRQPIFSAHAPSASDAQDIPVVHDAAPVIAHEPPTIPAITNDTMVPVIDTPVVEAPTTRIQAATVTEESVATNAGKADKREVKAGKRKIIALRLAAPGRIPGDQLLSLMQREDMQHGRFDIFHRMHEDASVFSMASMVEPGTFDLGTIREQQFPGVTFFMLLPGPLDGLVAWDQMLTCAQRMAHFTEGVLQDERGHKLTSMAMDRLREEVLDFQHLLGSVDAVSGSIPGSAAHPTPG